jgi:glycosyltransferase involved in cell wall biosynthesis
MPKLRRIGSISVFFPAFNDAATISGLVADALEILPAFTDDYEVIVVNDGSADATPAVLEQLARTVPRLKVIHHARNLGYGAALRTGLSQASKELIFYTDGDGQYDVRELASLIPLLTEPVDVVNGYKLQRGDARRRIVLGAVYQRMARWLFRLPIRDVDCDFRLLRRRALERIELVSSSGAICVELVSKLRAAGSVFAEAPVQHYPRAHGQSQFFTLPRVARTLRDFLRLWLKLMILPRLTGRVARPRRLGATWPSVRSQ